MFIQNKYHLCYFNIVKRAKSRSLPPETYVERHHIIPKSLGGGNSKDNVAILTAKEHAICHLLLVKMTEGENKMKMACAAWRMMFSSKQHGGQRHKLSAKTYEIIRVEMAKAAAKRSSEYRHTDEQKKKIGDSKRGKKRIINDEWRAKIIQSQTGIKKPPCSDERKQKISEALTGVKTGPMSDEAKAKLSAAKKGRKIQIDPVTGRRFYQALA